MKYVFILLIGLFSTPVWAQTKADTLIQSGSYAIPVYNFDGLQPLLQTNSDSVFVINLWATWCVPCVEELPEFIQFEQDYLNTKVKLILVSLDMQSKITYALIPFLQSHKITTKTVVLSDPDMNRWIPLMDKNWEGTIPATLIYSKNKRQFYPHPFTYEELVSEVKNFLN